jgi:hypothetical protein
VRPEGLGNLKKKKKEKKERKQERNSITSSSLRPATSRFAAVPQPTTLLRASMNHLLASTKLKRFYIPEGKALLSYIKM